jgi:uncharacterized protein
MFKILIKLILSILMITTLSACLQDKMIFQSRKLNATHTFVFRQPYTEYFIKTPDSIKLNALHFKTEKPCKGFVLYFHGNADNLQRWGKYASDFTDLGYDILMVDYRGYGKSTGKPNEKVLYEDAETVWQWAKERFQYSRWVIYGRSLGSAVATHLAKDVKPDILGLETPFSNLRFTRLARAFPLKLKYKFSNFNHLHGITCKKYIFHGTRDWVVPLRSALQLKPLLSEQDAFIIIEKGGHKNLNTFELYRAKLAELLL